MGGMNCILRIRRTPTEGRDRSATLGTANSLLTSKAYSRRHIRELRMGGVRLGRPLIGRPLRT